MFVATVVDIEQAYGGNVVLSGLNWDIPVGVHGLLGPNGAGKTTFLRTLATVMPPRVGSVTVCGETVVSERIARSVRRDIGYLPQDFGFYPGFSAYDFVRYCAWMRAVPKARIDSAAVEAIAAVALTDRRDALMKTLSGGMLRRAGIASAIVGKPRLLLLDEPTVGLDPAQRLEFRDLLRSLTDTAIVLSTHLVEDIGAVCDSVTILDRGRFIFKDTPVALAAADTGCAGDSPLERGYMSLLARNGALA